MGWREFITYLTGLGAETRWQNSQNQEPVSTVPTVEEGFRQLDRWFGDV